RLDDDRSAHKAEPLPDAVLEKPFKREVQFARVVGKGDEHRGSDSALGKVIDSRGLPGGGCSALEIHLLEKLVHFRRGNTQAASFRNLGDGLEQIAQLLAT